MADSFHFNISIISRGKGKSAVASVAYISCEKDYVEYPGRKQSHADDLAELVPVQPLGGLFGLLGNDVKPGVEEV